MISTVQRGCTVSWGAVLMGIVQCAPRYCRHRAGRCAGFSSLCAVPVATLKASPFIVLFISPFLSKEGAQSFSLSVFGHECQCIDTLELPVRCWRRRLASQSYCLFPNIVGVVGAVVYHDTTLLSAPAAQLSDFSVGVRHLGSSVFYLSCMVAIFDICAHFGVSWYTRLCNPVMSFSVWWERVDVMYCTPSAVRTLQCLLRSLPFLMTRADFPDGAPYVNQY